MEKKIISWVARDKNGDITLFMTNVPFKESYTWVPESYENPCMVLDKNDFPQVKWEDKEPTEVELIIKIKK